MDYTKELNFALNLARRSGEIHQAKSIAELDVERKSDHSPVTAVDRMCEALIQDGLRKSFENDGFIGEENGTLEGTSVRTWIVDPLDGTRPYIRGIPTYSCLIALEEEGEPVVGVIHFEALKKTYWAAKGAGAFLNGEAIKVSSTRQLSNAMGSSLGQVQHQDTPIGKRLLSAMREWDYAYGFMDNYSYACIASGALDLCVNLLDKAWDCAAAACIVSEAGGTYSDIDGHKTVHNGSIVLSNGFLHESILARINS